MAGKGEEAGREGEGEREGRGNGRERLGRTREWLTGGVGGFFRLRSPIRHQAWECLILFHQKGFKWSVFSVTPDPGAFPLPPQITASVSGAIAGAGAPQTLSGRAPLF